jgi:hypothetical protein
MARKVSSPTAISSTDVESMAVQRTKAAVRHNTMKKIVSTVLDQLWA